MASNVHLFVSFLFGVIASITVLYALLKKRILFIYFQPSPLASLPAPQSLRKSQSLKVHQEVNLTTEEITIEGMLKVQLAGKVSTRDTYYCSLKGSVLCIKHKKGDPDEKLVCLQGCKLKRIEEKKEYEHALEIYNQSKPIFPPKIDYIYLFAKTEANIDSWFNALSSICIVVNHLRSSTSDSSTDEQTNDDSMLDVPQAISPSPEIYRSYSSPSHNFSYQTFQNFAAYGLLKLQRGDKKTTKTRFCILLFDAMFLHFKSDKIFASKNVGIVDLKNCTVSNVDKTKSSILIKRVDPPLLTTTDNLTITTENSESKEIWLKAIKDVTDHPKLRESPSSMHDISSSFWLQKMTEGTSAESTRWMNRLLQVFFENIRLSPEVIEKLREKLKDKLITKIYQKRYNNIIQSISVDTVDLGTKAPEILSASIASCACPTEAGVDFDIEYKGSLTSKILMTFCLPSRTINATVNASLRSLKGKLAMRCEEQVPRFSLSFLEKPDMKIVIEVSSTEYDTILSRIPNIHTYLVKKLESSFCEKLVSPNRLYIPIPKAQPKIIPEPPPLPPQVKTRTPVGIIVGDGENVGTPKMTLGLVGLTINEGIRAPSPLKSLFSRSSPNPKK